MIDLPAAALTGLSGIEVATSAPASTASAPLAAVSDAASPLTRNAAASTMAAPPIFSTFTIHGLSDGAGLGRWLAAAATGVVATAFALNERDQNVKAVCELVHSIRR